MWLQLWVGPHFYGICNKTSVNWGSFSTVVSIQHQKQCATEQTHTVLYVLFFCGEWRNNSTIRVLFDVMWSVYFHHLHKQSWVLTERQTPLPWTSEMFLSQCAKRSWELVQNSKSFKHKFKVVFFLCDVRLMVPLCSLQPQNILLTSLAPPGDIKIVDFGLARRLGAVGELREILGTPEYVGKVPKTHSDYTNTDRISAA